MNNYSSSNRWLYDTKLNIFRILVYFFFVVVPVPMNRVPLTIWVRRSIIRIFEFEILINSSHLGSWNFAQCVAMTMAMRFAFYDMKFVTGENYSKFSNPAIPNPQNLIKTATHL